MFDKILIANRGEIACRVMATCRRLGIATVAIYSEADAAALHVRLADQALCVGPAAARDSYLRIAAIIDAARRSGAQAIHPGYGFLSENPEFAQACAAAGLTFIGPPVAAMRAMSSKASAKELMQRCGVPLLPGYHGEDQDAVRLRSEAERIGYPVLIKATAGGGGKGMRAVDSAAEFDERLASCQREARSSFNDARVLLEKYLQHPRHIEVQIFGDNARTDRAPVRARLLGAAAPSKGAGGSPGAASGRRAARRHDASGLRCGARGRLHRGRHGGIPARAGRRLLLHGDEYAHPGRASGHRDDHRPRPGRMAVARRRRRSLAAEPG